MPLTNMIIIAHDIRSLHNVGSILRNAAAFGAEKVYLTGYTGQPPRKEIAKVSLGAENLVPWEGGEITAIISTLKTTGYTILALENTATAQDIATLTPGKKYALVLGSEVEGIAPEVLNMCEAEVIIPMHAKRSLNVSVASGVAMYILSKI